MRTDEGGGRPSSSKSYQDFQIELTTRSPSALSSAIKFCAETAAAVVGVLARRPRCAHASPVPYPPLASLASRSIDSPTLSLLRRAGATREAGSSRCRGCTTKQTR